MTNEELSLHTKQKLAEALKKAMEKKPLSKVTVSELVRECDINRKTFYYHFQDIYDLFKWTLDQEAIDVVKQFNFAAKPEESIRFIMDYLETNRHIINCAYDSMGHDALKRFLYKDLFSTLYKLVEDAERNLHLTVDRQFKEFLTAFFTEATAGMLVNYLKYPGNADKETVLQNILLIYRTSLLSTLKEKANGTA